MMTHELGGMLVQEGGWKGCRQCFHCYELLQRPLRLSLGVAVGLSVVPSHCTEDPST